MLSCFSHHRSLFVLHLFFSFPVSCYNFLYRSLFFFTLILWCVIFMVVSLVTLLFHCSLTVLHPTSYIFLVSSLLLITASPHSFSVLCCFACLSITLLLTQSLLHLTSFTFAVLPFPPITASVHSSSPVLSSLSLYCITSYSPSLFYLHLLSTTREGNMKQVGMFLSFTTQGCQLVLCILFWASLLVSLPCIT